jgi:AcrR family transcriptional regulator
MDQVRDTSGVSLKRLYRLFPGKDQLAGAVLRRRDRQFREELSGYLADRSDPRDRVLGVFDYLYEWFTEPDYRGCPFVNAFGEMGAGSRRVSEAVEEQKRAFEAFLSELVRAAGWSPPLGTHLYLLANGAMVAAAIRRSPEPAREARAAALSLLEHHRIG